MASPIEQAASRPEMDKGCMSEDTMDQRDETKLLDADRADFFVARKTGVGLTTLRSGKEVYVECVGSGSPVLFIHGIGGSLEVFSPLIPMLSKNHKAISYESDGTGSSLSHLVQEAADVLALHSPAEPATIVGHSMGTVVAANLAISHPPMVARLILLNPITVLGDERRASILERAKTVRSESMFAVASAIAASETSPSCNPLATEFIVELLGSRNPEAYVRQCEVLATADDPDWTKLRKMPILAICGGAYCGSPEASNESDADAIREIGDLVKVKLDGCGLWPTLESPEETAQLIRHFLDTVDEHASDGEAQDILSISAGLSPFLIESTLRSRLQQLVTLCVQFEMEGLQSAIDKARKLLGDFPPESALMEPIDLVLLVYARARVAQAIYDFSLSGSELVAAHESYQRATHIMIEQDLQLESVGDEILCRSIWVKTFHFAYTLKMGDLSPDLHILEDINNRTDDAHHLKPLLLLCLCRAWRWQWYHLGWGQDKTALRTASEYGHTAIRLVPSNWLDMPMLLSEVGAVLIDMQQGQEHTGPVLEAVEAFKKATEILNSRSYQRILDLWTALGQSGRAYHRLCYLEGCLSHMDSAIDGCRELISKASWAELPASTFTNLSIFLMDRFSMTSRIADIDESILVLNQLLERVNTSSVNRDWASLSLGLSHSHRYLSLGERADFDAARSRLDDVLQRSEANGFSNPLAKSAPLYLAYIFMHRYDQERAEDDLDKAVDFARKSVVAAGDKLAVVEGRTTLLGLCLSKRFELKGHLSDLVEALDLHETTRSVIPPVHPSRFAVLWHSASALRARYVWSNDTEDFYRCVDTLEEALEGAKRYHHPGQVSCACELGRAFSVHYQRTMEGSSLQKSLRYYFLAAESNEGNAKERFAAAIEGAETAQRHQDLEASYALYAIAVGLLSRLAWIGLRSQSRHASLSTSAFQVACDAAAMCISVGKPEQAVELLDEGRSVLWRSILDVRTDLTALQSYAPELAAELATVSTVLAAEEPGVEMLSERHAEERAQHRRRTAEQWDSLIAEVRKLDGFESFLKPLGFSKLRQAAAGGPVVILNVSKYRSDALIITVDQPVRVVPLRVSLDSVRQMADVFEKSLRVTHDTRGLNFVERIMHNISRSLWNAGLGTVANLILARGEQQRGPQRIWLVAAGVTGILPVHCAGPYDGHTLGLADLFIPSYTTTLSALLKARSHVAPKRQDPPRLLAVSQPDVDGMCSLETAGLEMEAIRSLSLPDSLKTFLDKPTTTPSECLTAFSTHSWIHCCAHGTRDPRNPLSNAIRLSAGRLTLSHIVQLDLSSTAEFAFLSACHTARQSSTLPDEAMHFAAGLQIAGFRSVVGTAWGMADMDGPLLTSLFYNNLMEGGALQVERTAEALAHALNFMRRRGVPIYRWGAFVHYGI